MFIYFFLVHTIRPYPAATEGNKQCRKNRKKLAVTQQ